MLAFIRAMAAEQGWELEEVLPLATANPARLLRLGGKGRIAVGADADILLLQASALAGVWWAGGRPQCSLCCCCCRRYCSALLTCT